MKNDDYKKLTEEIHSKKATQAQQPGVEYTMKPQPKTDDEKFHQAKLLNKVAIITGGDSGIGRSVALFFAREGADITISYLNEEADALITKQEVEKFGRRCLLLPGDIGNESLCKHIVEKTLKEFGKIDILVNNAAEQHTKSSIEDISAEQLLRTFSTNIFSFFYMVKAVLPHLKEGSTIINSTSVTSYKGSEHLLDYSATKGAIVAFTRSLSNLLIKKGIRVNGVAPGPIWTPLIPASFSQEEIAEFGKNVPMGRPGQPEEVAPCYVFLASNDSSYMSGQILHPNGGVIVNG